MHLSLSRFNHWLPRSQAHPEVVQGTTEFHHQIADTFFPQADTIFDDTTTLDTAVDMLDPQSAMVQPLVRYVLLPREFLAAGFLRRHQDLHLGQREREKAQILQQATSRRQGIWCRVSNMLVMGAAAISVTEKEDEEQGIDEQDIFHGVVFFLAAITLFVFNRVLGADDASFGPVMGKRGPLVGRRMR